MIPKLIHYCWFGNNPLSREAKKCIESWKKHFPDYEIIEWNETNFDLNICSYVKEAYEAKKWAFVSDYVRFKVLYDNGGLYFDTDVEVISDMNDIIGNGPFLGCEPSEGDILWNKNNLNAVNPGLCMGAVPKMPFYKEVLESYSNDHFKNDNGGLNLKTIVTRTTALLKKYGFDESLNNIQKIAGIFIYPVEYFCPKNYVTGELNVTENTKSIHHFSASWKSENEKKWKILEANTIAKYGKVFGRGIFRNPIVLVVSNLYIHGFYTTLNKVIFRLKQLGKL